VADLRPTIPALAKTNHATVPFLNESRALSACTAKVLIPFATKPIPDPDFPKNSGQPFYKQSSRGLVGLSGESRINDANSPLFHVQQGGGPFTFLQTDESTGTARVPFGGLIFPIEGTRPGRPDHRPADRPDVPCETQQVPDLNAPLGPADPSATVSNPGGLLPPLPKNQVLAKRGEIQVNEIEDFLTRTAQGKPGVDPVGKPQDAYLRGMKKLGLEVLPSGKVRKASK
jgi:hypothetical protein